MATSSTGRKAPLAALVLAVLLAVPAALAAGSLSVAPRFQREDGVYVVRSGNMEYRFDAVWRTESLMTGVDGEERTDLASAGPRSAERMLRMRGTLLRAVGVTRLEDISQEGTAELESLRSLGYL